MGRPALIVDDHAGFRRAARRLFEAAGFTVVGEAADAEGALVAAVALRPEVILLDVHLPDGNGFDVAGELCAVVPAAQVILTSTRDASDFQARLPAAAACGFIAKSELTGPGIVGLVGAA